MHFSLGIQEISDQRSDEMSEKMFKQIRSGHQNYMNNSYDLIRTDRHINFVLCDLFVWYTSDTW
jgi:hypothetical protein